MLNPVLVRIELDQMRHTVMHAFNNQQIDLAADVDREISKAVKDFDMRYATFVEEQVNLAIKQEIQRFFTCGNGFRAIRAVVKEALETGD